MSHSHSHHEHASQDNYSRAFLIGIVLNISFVAIEIIYGLLTNSVALLADAGHNFSDVIGLILSWGAFWLSRKKASSKFTYGFKGTSILAALANAILLLIATGAITWEAIQRLAKPEPVAGVTVIVVAAIGIAINGFTAFLFLKGRKNDLNIQSAFLHMAADALVSLGVVIAGVIIWKTGWLWMDPLVGLIIAITIVIGTWGLFKESVRLSINAVPNPIQVEKVKEFLENVKGVSRVHDLHIWAMSTTENALTAHLIIPEGHPGDHFLNTVAHQVEEKFKIHHTTIQIELGDSSHPCELETGDR
jgi:cobalt-zinc-cadmium efflux system protein